MLTLWLIVFFASLTALVKGSDWLLSSAEKIGLRLGLSPFVVGVLIVGVGTSLPELVSSFAAVWNNVGEVVAANAVGSNIANILLVIGVAAVMSKKLEVAKDLIDSELPMLAISTVLFLGVVYDGSVTLLEAVFLVAAYLVYLFYTLDGEGDETVKKLDFIPEKKPDVGAKEYVLLVVGAAGLSFGAHFLIESVIALSALLNIVPGVIAITAIAVGTSLPELLVSVKAAKSGRSDIAIGNIFGSNAFNLLMVVGIPGIIASLSFVNLTLDAQTLLIGVPAMALATLLFVISGISRRIYRWEGLMFLIFYSLFTLKLFGLA